jgi:hypothetical protein
MVGSNNGSLRLPGMGVDCFAVAAPDALIRPVLQVVD